MFKILYVTLYRVSWWDCNMYSTSILKAYVYILSLLCFIYIIIYKKYIYNTNKLYFLSLKTYIKSSKSKGLGTFHPGCVSIQTLKYVTAYLTRQIRHYFIGFLKVPHTSYFGKIGRLGNKNYWTILLLVNILSTYYRTSPPTRF